MQLSRGQWIEVGFWTAFAAAAFALTYNFNQDLDIYEFGAYGWPRAVIILIALTLAGQIFHDLRHGVSAKEDADEETGMGSGYAGRMTLTLGLPLVFALLLQPVGFYVLTPFFIAAFLMIAGERRPLWIIGVTAGLYVFLVFVFVKVFFVGLPVGTVQVFYDISNAILGVVR